MRPERFCLVVVGALLFACLSAGAAEQPAPGGQIYRAITEMPLEPQVAFAELGQPRWAQLDVDGHADWRCGRGRWRRIPRDGIRRHRQQRKQQDLYQGVVTSHEKPRWMGVEPLRTVDAAYAPP